MSEIWSKGKVNILYAELVHKKPRITLQEALFELSKIKSIPPLALQQWFIEQLNMRAEAKRNERKE